MIKSGPPFPMAEPWLQSSAMGPTKMDDKEFILKSLYISP